jgi:fission process protein 1
MVWGLRQKETPPASPAEVDQPVTREKLPSKLQQLVDKEEDFYDDMYAP